MALRRTCAKCAVLGIALGCSEAAPRDRFAREEEPLHIVSTFPAQGAEGVYAYTTIDFCLDAIVDPSSVSAFDLTLSSGPQLFDTELSLQPLAYRTPGGALSLDEIDDPALQNWCPGSVLSVRPLGGLRAGVRYRVRLRPGIRGWKGEEFDTYEAGWLEESDGDRRYHLEFVAALDVDPGQLPDAPEPPPPRTLDELFEPGAVFDLQQGACSCHQDPDDPALERLDLRDLERARDSLLGSSAIGSTGARRVAPGDPAASFLIQKLLHDPREDDASSPDAAALQGVFGQRMPLGEALSVEHRSQIMRWVADGAL